MAQYTLYSVSFETKDAFFTTIEKKSNNIEHPSFKEFTIENKAKYILCNGKEILELPFGQDAPIFGEVNVKVIIARYKITYALFSISGSGLFAIRSPLKYINEKIIPYLKDYIYETYNIKIDFEKFIYDNKHFTPKYWGNDIKSKRGYNSKKKMYIKLSSSSLKNLLDKNPDLQKYFSSGSIKSISGKINDLEYIEDKEKKSGDFNFNRQGIIKWNNDDIILFNEFIKIMIKRGFYIRIEGANYGKC